MARISGSCLCGEVRYELEDDFGQFHWCYCRQCQKASGSAHASNLFTDPKNINWIKGLELVLRYDVPNRSISNAFCTRCGSGMPYLSKSGKALIVPAGALDAKPSINPGGNIFWAERAEWYDAGLLAEHYDEFP